MTRIREADQFIASLGLEAYRVGGSVRDEILGRKPKDADYIVRGVSLGDLGWCLDRDGAKISAIVARDKAHLGWRAYIIGIGMIEVVLPRVERSTGSGRDMAIQVDPSLSLAEDAKRRDFTFNALYKGVGDGYPESAAEGGVVDPTGDGLYDLQHRIVRVTHAESFIDDPLRMLRALRFVSTLNADLEGTTRALMYVYHQKVDGLTDKGVSGTVFEEFSKMLMGQAPAKALRIARDTGVLAVALPELEPMLGHEPGSRYHDLNTDEHTFKALETAAHVDAPLRVRWALLFHDSGKPDVQWVGVDGRRHYYEPSEAVWRKVIETYNGDAVFDGVPSRCIDHEVASHSRWLKAAHRLNMPRDLRRDVAELILHHMVPTKTKNIGTRVRRMRVQFGDELLHDLFLHRTCDLSGKGVKVALNHIEHIAKMERERAAAQENGIPASVKDLEVGGKDAISFGLQGSDIGGALNRLLDEVVCQPDELRLSREWQLARLSAMASHVRKLV